MTDWGLDSPGDLDRDTVALSPGDSMAEGSSVGHSDWHRHRHWGHWDCWDNWGNSYGDDWARSETSRADGQTTHSTQGEPKQLSISLGISFRISFTLGNPVVEERSGTIISCQACVQGRYMDLLLSADMIHNIMALLSVSGV
jgi:hypothetical protein